METTMDSLMFDLMDSEHDVLEDVSAINNMYRLLADAENSIAKLTHIKATIEEFGISGPMMKMADAEGELSTAGIVPDYESLPTVNSHDSSSQAVLESIGSFIIDSLKSLVKFFLNMGATVKKFIKDLIRNFTNYEKILLKIKDRLDKITVDDAKLAPMKAKMYSKNNYNRVKTITSKLYNLTTMSEVSNAIAEVDKAISSYLDDKSTTLDVGLSTLRNFIKNTFTVISLDPELDKTVGLKVVFDRVDSNIVTDIAKSEPKVKQLKMSIANSGWDSNGINNALLEILSYLKLISKDRDAMMRLAELNTMRAKVLSSLAKEKFLGQGDANLSYMMEAINETKRAVRFVDITTRTSLIYTQRLAMQCYMLGGMALKAKKK